MSSIVGRFLNWCLVPMYTYTFAAAEYGVVTNLYAYVALVLIILTYGMETGFFRFATMTAGPTRDRCIPHRFSRWASRRWCS